MELEECDNISNSTRKRLKHKQDDEEEDEFIVSDEEDENSIPYTLKQLLESEDVDCPFLPIKTTREAVPPVSNTIIPFRIPIEIFSPLGEEYSKYIEQDKELKLKFEEFINCNRSEWKDTDFYKKLYNTVIINSITIGRASRKNANKKLLELSMENRILCNEYTSIQIEIDKCDGCDIKHKVLSYIFFTYDKDGNQEQVLKMGCVCGSKVNAVIKIYQLLNSIGFIPEEKKEWFKNIHTLLNYWSSHALDIISNTIWKEDIN